MKAVAKNQDFILPSGQHVGTRITRIPRSYLLKMVSSDFYGDYAVAELERRGTPVTSVKVTGHAIDRFSLRFTSVYLRYRDHGEGLFSWLARAATAALLEGPDYQGRHPYLGLLWIFEVTGRKKPVLKTVHGDGNAPKEWTI